MKTQRTAKNGDLVLFDYEGKIDDKAFDSGKGKDETVVLGSNKYIPGYEEQMVGLKVGEEKDIKVTFPNDYREKKLANKKAVFKLNIKDIQERVVKVPIDDQLAKELGEKNLDDLKKKIEEKIKADFQNLSSLKMRRQATELLLRATDFELPSKMVEEEINFLKSNAKDKKAKEIENLAKRRVKLGIIINSVSEVNKIVVEDADLTKQLLTRQKSILVRNRKSLSFIKITRL